MIDDDFDRGAIIEEMDDARATLHRLLAVADGATLRRRSNGTRWTNEELLFHMVFGYMIVRALLVLVRIFGRLPAPVSKGFAAVLNALTAPFHVVNYWGSRLAATTYNDRRMGAKLDRVVASLQRRLRREDAWQPGAVDELPDPVGSVLHTDHDTRRGLPLPNTALRFPPPAAQRTARPDRRRIDLGQASRCSWSYHRRYRRAGIIRTR